MTYHKFVKTTPNPNATKNNSGELVGPGVLLLPGEVVAVGGAVDVALMADIEDDDVGLPGHLEIRDGLWSHATRHT